MAIVIEMSKILMIVTPVGLSLDEFVPWVISGFISWPTFYTLVSMKLHPSHLDRAA